MLNISSPCGHQIAQTLSEKKPFFFGILGATRPLAAATFSARLVALAYADSDPHHIPALRAIDAGKSNRLEIAVEPALAGIQALKRQGARAAVLDCTELPLTVSHALRPLQNIILTDSIDALALSVIERYAPMIDV